MNNTNWVRKGKIFSPTGNYPWMNSYASQVCAMEFDDFIRIYFTTRSELDINGNYEARITFLDCEKKNPQKILYVHDKPLLSLGQAGTFDEHGSMMCEILFHDNKYWLYYLGWQRSGTVPYINSLGLALSEDGHNFSKISEGPIIGLNRFVPFGIAKSSILIEDGVFNMWYTHYLPWEKSIIKDSSLIGKENFRPNYDIRLATSTNGMDWKFGERCLTLSNQNQAIATPCVRKINDAYYMWYGYRDVLDKSGNSGSYKIGCATSVDKMNWKMDFSEHLVCDGNQNDWDTEMQCYPNVLKSKHDDFLYLFYSGNHYGRDGFGYAVIAMQDTKLK